MEGQDENKNNENQQQEVQKDEQVENNAEQNQPSNDQAATATTTTQEETKQDAPSSGNQSDQLGSENFLAKLDEKIQENQKLHNEQVKSKVDNLRTDIDSYFTRLSETIVKQIQTTKDSVLSKVDSIIEKETGFVDWDHFKGELLKKKEVYEQTQDLVLQKKLFDEYFEYYNSTLKRVESANSAAYNTIDNTAKLFKFDEIVLDDFIVKFKSLCSVLESDFVTNVSFTANHFDANQVRLEEYIQIPHPGVWCAAEKIEKLDVFLLGGRDGRVSMYDSKLLRIIEVIQAVKTFVACILYVPQYNLLLVGGADSKIAARRVDGRNFGQHIAYLEADGYVTFLQYLEDENVIVSIGTDPNIRVYNPTSLIMTGKIPTSRTGAKPRGGSHYFKDKKLLLVGYDDGMFQFYNMKTRKLAYAIFVGSTNYWGLEFHQPTQKLYAHTSPNTVKVWDFKGERPVDENEITLEGEGENVYNIRVIDNYLFSAGNNEKITIYDLQERKILKKIEVPTFKCQGLLVLKKEGRIIVTDEDSSKVASLRFN